MLIEVKARVKHIIKDRSVTKTDVFLTEKDTFTEAEQAVAGCLDSQINDKTAEEYEIYALYFSSVKEVMTQYKGDIPYIVVLVDTFVDTGGNEKKLKYKLLFWADNLSEAHTRAQDIAAQGYNMHIESLKESSIQYL